MSHRPPISHARWAIALAATLLLAAPPAVALAGNPNYRSVIEKVSPSVPGISLHVLEYDSFFELRDSGGHEVVVYGYEDEPYARILKDGTVQVNQHSPATYLNTSFFANAKVPAFASSEATTEWKTQSHNGVFVWHDHRMHYMSPAIPEQVKDTSRKTKVFDYEVPLKIDGKKGAIHGTLFWVGSPSASKLPIILASVVVLIGAVGLVLRSRRGRRGGRDGDGGNDDGDLAEPQASPGTQAW